MNDFVSSDNNESASVASHTSTSGNTDEQFEEVSDCCGSSIDRNGKCLRCDRPCEPIWISEDQTFFEKPKSML